MGSDETKRQLSEREKEINKLKLENSALVEDYEKKMMDLKDDKEKEKIEKEIEKMKLENERIQNELKIKEQEQKRIEMEKKEEKEKEIKRFRESQNISLFLTLIEKFDDDLYYLGKTLEALDEEAVIKNYEAFKGKIRSRIQIIKNRVYGDYKLSPDCEKKLVIILLCIEKNNYNCDDVLERLVKIGSNKKELLFNILLEYSKEFGKDVYFRNEEIYEEFVDYSLKNKKYLESLDYKNGDIIQLKILYEKKEVIFNSQKIIDKIIRLNEYDKAHEIIQKIIKFQKIKQKKFVSFKKQFWENYFIYTKLYTDDNDKIRKLAEIYNLLLSYIALENDDTEFKEILAQKIHEFILERLDKISIPRNQLEFLFKYDPYYTSSCYERDPKVLEKINILELIEGQDIDYFTNLNLEKVFSEDFTSYLNIIIAKIEEIEDFDSIIKIIKINQKENREKYINLLSERYSEFTDEKLTIESFMNFFKKILEYNPKIKLEILEKNLPRFAQKNKIYLKIFDSFKENDEIKEKIAVLSANNLKLFVLIDLIKNIKDEETKKDYFNYLSIKVIKYDDFFKLEDSDNLKLLSELMEKNLIPESVYLDKNKDILQKIYNKLITYDETKSKYLDTVINEKEEIAKIYSERFKLFKLIKGEKYEPISEFNKIKKKYFEVEKDIEKAHQISDLLNLYFKESNKKEIDMINNIYNVYSIKDIKACLWLNKEEEINDLIRKLEDKANLIKIIKDIKLFQIIYNEITEENENDKFNRAKELLDYYKFIFEEMKIEKGDSKLLDLWQNSFKEEENIKEELKKLKDYYKIENNEGFDKIIKNILILTNSDIKCLLYFFKLFGVEETDFSKKLKEYLSELEKKENINFQKLININNYLEEKQIYINEGKDDSLSIKLVRLFNNRENEINFAKSKDVDSASTLLYRLIPTNDSLKFNDILEYQSCIYFIKDFILPEITDEKFIEKMNEKVKKYDINKLLSIFENYFRNYISIKMIDSNFDSSKDIYENIKLILNNSEFKIEFFKRKFKVYDDNKKEKEIIIQDLDGLIQLKDNINLNFEDLPDNNNINEKSKEELKIKRAKIEIFVKYVEQMRNIIYLFSKLENKGCPFLIDILVTTKKDKITFELVNTVLSYKELILKLKQFLFTLLEFQNKFYKENEYFRLIYDKQLYRLFQK